MIRRHVSTLIVKGILETRVADRNPLEFKIVVDLRPTCGARWLRAHGPLRIATRFFENCPDRCVAAMQSTQGNPSPSVSYLAVHLPRSITSLVSLTSLVPISELSTIISRSLNLSLGIKSSVWEYPSFLRLLTASWTLFISSLLSPTFVSKSVGHPVTMLVI